MGILETVDGPDDLKRLDGRQVEELAEHIRTFLIENVSKTGGHLGPNLGVVELTLAIHRVFDSPTDSIIFDTGHQSYVHKLVTGRKDFSRLRQYGGLSGYPDRRESPHDILQSSHASSSLSWADGISRAHQLAGKKNRYVVAVIGDGALTGGMTWEALNNIAADKHRRLVIVVNDNGRSYAPTVGGLANYLHSLRPALDSVRTHQAYESTMERGKRALQQGGPVRRLLYRCLHAIKKGAKDWWAPQGLFDDLGLKYLGPVDGHDQHALETALEQAKNYGGPVIVHTITEKGRGYRPAREDEADQFHTVGVMNPETGLPMDPTGQDPSWTSVFGDEMLTLAQQRSDLIAITAAMLIPVGLTRMAERYPERVLDVGIAEQHAIAMAAGMAYGGLHPVIALYATFLNRGFDQLLMDAALHRAGITLVLDRAGVTGPDGASHHGMWDMAILQVIPGLHLAAPRDGSRLREELREAIAMSDAPTVLRYPKGTVGEDIPALVRQPDGVDILAQDSDGAQDVLLVAVGAMAALAMHVCHLLRAQGIGTTVIDPRWVLPVPSSMVSLAASHRLVVVIEDGVRAGGVGSRMRQQMRAAGVDTALNEVGLPAEFLAQGSRSQILEDAGVSARRIAHDIVAQVLGTKVPYARAASLKKRANSPASAPSSVREVWGDQAGPRRN